VSPATDGLALHPFRALRPTADDAHLGALLCPPYDVIDEAARAALLARDPHNAVELVLPQSPGGGDRYAHAARLLADGVSAGRYAVDDMPALYVYEMAETGGSLTRGLLGAIELRDPAGGVILPHENTMAGPVADRLALMEATQADLEPIYLVYDGGGTASQAVRDVDTERPLAQAQTPDGVTHRLWALTDPALHAAVAADLADRRALIADGHHRYATYRQRQQNHRSESAAGPWDRGLTLLVDSSSYGPQVHAIHRVLVGVALQEVLDRAAGALRVTPAPDATTALAMAAERTGWFAAVLGDGDRTVLVEDNAGTLAAAAHRPQDVPALAELDVTVLHRGLVEHVLALPDSVEQVGYAHSVAEALDDAVRSGGTAVLLRPTPVAAVAAVAAEGGRMPRKSTLFTPKPASGLVMRRLHDEPDGAAR
jgi:uncharacterized protein (DUF1015 family)